MAEAVAVAAAVPAGSGPGEGQPPVQRVLSTQRPPPSPFEDVALDGTRGGSALPAPVPVQAPGAGDEPGKRSPRNVVAPTKSALKISKDGEAGADAPQKPAPSRALTWADTHGQVRAGAAAAGALGSGPPPPWPATARRGNYSSALVPLLCRPPCAGNPPRAGVPAI